VVRAVHGLEHEALDLAHLQVVGQLGAGAALVDQVLHVLALDKRRELALRVVREVPAGLVQVQLADVRREDLGVTLLLAAPRR
jgi:hypothetical protein